jgi:hypothetical protein
VTLRPQEGFGLDFTLEPPEIFPKLLPGFDPIEFEPGSNLAGGMDPICGEKAGGHPSEVLKALGM